MKELQNPEKDKNKTRGEKERRIASGKIEGEEILLIVITFFYIVFNKKYLQIIQKLRLRVNQSRDL